MLEQVVNGVWSWSVLSEEKGYPFNGYAVATEEGPLLIDPPDPGREGWAAFDSLAPFQGVWVTNRNHSRAAARFRERYGTPVWAHEQDAERLEAGADRQLRSEDTIAGEIEVVHVPGKSPGEVAFYLPGRRALIVGDLVIGVPPGELSTYPDDVLDDKRELYRSVEKLLGYEFDALLLSDGEPVPTGGREKLRGFLEQASGDSVVEAG